MPKFLDGQTNIFTAEVVLILVAALEDAWTAVHTSGMQLDGHAADAQQILARRIIETAKNGERDPSRLVGDAVGHLARTIGPSTTH